MSDRPLDDFLQGILREIERIERFTADVTTLQQFEQDEKTTYAVIRSLELISDTSLLGCRPRNSLGCHTATSRAT